MIKLRLKLWRETTRTQMRQKQVQLVTGGLVILIPISCVLHNNKIIQVCFETHAGLSVLVMILCLAVRQTYCTQDLYNMAASLCCHFQFKACCIFLPNCCTLTPLLRLSNSRPIHAHAPVEAVDLQPSLQDSRDVDC